jgi:hypothetical protein
MAFTYGDTSGDLGDHILAGDQTLSLTIPPEGGSETLVGDANTLFDHAVGGNDILSGGVVVFASAEILGDAVTITDHAQGGNDQITDAGPYAAIGDAETLTGHAQGGDDTVSAPGGGTQGAGSIAMGDATTMNDHAHGGNDTVSATGTAYGDAVAISGSAVGGNDTVIALAGTGPGACGDAASITDHGQGGDDVVIGPTASQFTAQLSGDGSLSGNATGGNDTLMAQGATTNMYGDGLRLLDHSKGGNDTLISGSGNDQMWGDAATIAPTAQTGTDTFVFSLALIHGTSPSIGHDTIEDFQPGQDHIQIQGFENVTSFADVASHTTDTAQGALITIDANDSILVANDHNLNSGDFFFT